MRTYSIVALLGMSALGAGCIIVQPEPEPEPEPPRTFEGFEMSWGYGPCPPGEDCSGSLGLDAGGTLRLDTPCMTQLGIRCDRESSGAYAFQVSPADLDATVAVLAHPDLIRLLDRPGSVCEPVVDVGEEMRLRMDGVVHANQTVFCDDAPIVAAREALSALVAKYLGPEPPPGRVVLESAGWSFGHCLGQCVGDLAVDGGALRYTITGHRPEDPVYLDNAGTLTELGDEALRSILAGLAGETLEERYGCPDCADGGASHVTLARDGVTSTHTYEYNAPPSVLAELDALIDELVAALESCSANEYVAISAGCTPRPAD
jgi:hypothetical protein